MGALRWCPSLLIIGLMRFPRLTWKTMELIAKPFQSGFSLTAKCDLFVIKDVRTLLKRILSFFFGRMPKCQMSQCQASDSTLPYGFADITLECITPQGFPRNVPKPLATGRPKALRTGSASAPNISPPQTVSRLLWSSASGAGGCFHE